MGVFAGPEITESGLVLALDGANKKSFYGYWSGSYGTAANAFDGNLNTFSGGAGGTFSATYTFNNGLDVSGTVRVYVTFGASSGQVNGRTGVILIDGIDISSKMDAANVYASSPGWVDVTSEVGSIFNTVVLNGTSGSTNPSIAAIEVNGQILVGTTWAGTAWTDLSTNGNTGTLVNGVGYSASNGGSLSFDGSNDYVLLTRNDFNTSLPNFTISVFVYKISDGIILGNHRHNQTWESVWLSTTQFTVNDANGTANRQSLYHTTPINSWMNLVAVNNSSQNYMKVFLNGAEIATKTATVIPWNSSIIPTIGANLLVGDLSPVGPINGRISNTSIYNRALSAAEISQNFNALKGRFSI